MTGRREVDALVVGLGVIGAATAYSLARAGRRVLGIDRFVPPHTRGSSHGPSRAHSLFYSAPYLAMAIKAREGWLELEAERFPGLFHESGMLVYDHPGAEEFRKVVRALARAGVPHDLMSPAEVRKRFTDIRLVPGSLACLMPSAGFLDADRCVSALLEAARRRGAEIVTGVVVERIGLDGERPVAVTADVDFEAESIALCPGAWAQELLADLGWPLRVSLQNTYQFATHDDARYVSGHVPVLGDRIQDVYCFPVYQGAIKVAFSRLGPETSAESVKPAPGEPESSELAGWLRSTFAGLKVRALGGASCMYTLTPDRGFIVAQHPKHLRVVVGAGFSGHGFKFAPVIGELLASLANGLGPGMETFDPARFGSSAVPTG